MVVKNIFTKKQMGQMESKLKYFFFNFVLFCLEWEKGGEAEGEGERLSSLLPTEHRDSHWAQFHEPEIMI